MKHLFSILVMFGLATGFLTAQNRIITADFDRISVRNAFNIILIPSDRYEIIVPENLELPRGVEVKDVISVSRGTLTIAIPENWWRDNFLNFRRTNNNRQPDIRVYFVSLNSLNMAGVSSVTSEGTIYANTFQLSLAGSGRANLNIVANNITSGLSGSGRLTLTGKANEHNISISGSGRIDAENLLETKNSRVSISGSGRANVSAETVRVSISGSGQITLQAREVTGSISGSGRVMLNADARHSISVSGSGSVRTL